jgi:predicted N-formylglutamate amidohydrolase
MTRPRLLFTCEHGGNRVPAAYRSCFAGADRVLRSHRGYDPGAIEAARFLARRHRAPLIEAMVTRLLVELNRSRGHRGLFSEYTRRLDPGIREEILLRYWKPHRDRVEAAVAGGVRRGTVLHVAVHSFTPRLAGVTRNAEVGLLYDPRRPGEPAFCRAWRRAIRAGDPGLRVRLNYPYRGAADGLTTALRRQFDGERYLGVELELNQARLADPARRAPLLEAVIAGLAAALASGV